MKNTLRNFLEEKTNKVNKTVVLIFGIGYWLIISWFWNCFGSFAYSDFSEQITELFAVVVSIVITIVFLYCNLLLIAHLTRKNTNDFSWYIDSLKVLFSEEIWGQKYWWWIFLPLQIANFVLAIIFPEKFQIWLIFIPIVILGSLIIVHLERYKAVLTLFFGNILFAITAFVIINFKTLGVYFYWFLTGHDCFVNYGFEEPGDPLSNIEFFWRIEDWEALGNPVPSEDNQLEFLTHNFGDTVVFYLYPIVTLFVLFNTHYLFGKIATINLDNEQTKQE